MLDTEAAASMVVVPSLVEEVWMERWASVEVVGRPRGVQASKKPVGQMPIARTCSSWYSKRCAIQLGILH